MRAHFAAAAFALAACAGPVAAAPLAKGAAAPDFTLTSTTGGKRAPFNLKTELKKGPVVLYFYPAAFTAGCTIEAHMFAEATDDFKKAGAQVIGVSTDPIDKLDKFSTQECQGKFPLGADTDAKVAEAYGVKTSFMGRTIAGRTSYVIGKDGKIALVHSDNKPQDHITKTLAAVK
jgi:thioredoxin-dependent peroxiredoxin